MHLGRQVRRQALEQARNNKVPERGLCVLTGFESESDANDVVGSFSLLFHFEFKMDSIALGKNVTKSGVLHVALVKKNLVAVLGGDESKTLSHIVKLYGTVDHKYSSSRNHAN
jgi:hypothetical protein